MEETEYSIQSILTCALDLGEAMLSSGAEVYRVEDTISRICLSYGLKRADIFAIPNSIMATVYNSDGDFVTQNRRVRVSATNLNRVDKLNQLSRDICSKLPPASVVRRSVETVINETGATHMYTLLAYVVSTAAFCGFFGGTWRDMVSSALGGVLIFFMEKMFILGSARTFLKNSIPSAAAAAFAYFCVRIGLADQVSMIVIGEIMLFIPGMELTNGMRDFMAGDIIAGLSHMCEAICTAIAIAAGTAGMLALLGGIFG